jgi:tetratricopeptide (TPR) repeat protein
MIMRRWQGIFAAVIYFSFVGEAWPQESRATDYVHPPEVGALPKISPEESQRRLQDALLLFDRGKKDAAIYMLQQLEEDDPTNYKVLFKLGELAINAKNWAYAIQVLRKASILRPNDIEIRLVLLDIYKAYQMPLEEIIVAKEIIALDPHHIVALKRLAELYHDQAMKEEEIEIRQKLKHLTPDNYQNLKRLAVIFDENGQLWESAKVYEKIKKYYPEKLKDMRRLAAIYDELGENFRELLTLDHIAEQGGRRGWMQTRAITSLRRQTDTYDPLVAGLTVSKVKEDTLDVYKIRPEAQYTHILVNKSFDLGIEASFTGLRYKGRGELDGRADIYSSSVILKAFQNWLDPDFILGAHVGVIDDRVSGKLSLRNPAAGLGPADFPFLKDPTFKSYGGTIPIGGLLFKARQGLNTVYDARYKHDLIEEFDARLRLFTFDEITLGATYETRDHTALKLQIDNAFVSDGNYRLHGLASGYYTLWASEAMYDYRDRRQDFFRQPPPNFVNVGYELEYFKDRRVAEDFVYETFVSSEIRHKAVLGGQVRLFTLGPDNQFLFNLRLFYGLGTTLDYRRGLAARLFYFKPDSGNEIGLTYRFEDEKSTNREPGNLGIAGRTKGHQVTLNMRWRY